MAKEDGEMSDDYTMMLVDDNIDDETLDTIPKTEDRTGVSYVNQN